LQYLAPVSHPSLIHEPVAAALHEETSLDALGPGGFGTITALTVDAGEAGLLRAMGIAEGESVVLLRTGLGGDPLHVRLGSGGEFALARPLARSVRIQRAP
jgi:ferrous iron transport protein A